MWFTKVYYNDNRSQKKVKKLERSLVLPVALKRSEIIDIGKVLYVGEFISLPLQIAMHHIRS